MSTQFTEPSVGAPKTREVRLGLVMYGGVSLAVYINGVAREFFRAVRGGGVYKLVKALTDSDVVVDVISGTSAGGINGILLAYALCNEADFASSAQLWRRDADFRSLLRSPELDPDSTSSLLNSEGYYQPRLEDAFRYMPAYAPEGDGELNSGFDELDLYVTGTDVDGTVSTQFDDAGHPIDVKDHRSVFLLKHRRGRKEPFSPKAGRLGQPEAEVTYRALAKLGRITSCFPAAFAPVFVSKGETAEDRLLQLWGRLDKEASFLDGGVLDNKPFTYALKEIFNRLAERRVDRKLFYVEPDPEHLSRLETATQPNFLQAVIASLIGIPGYESISDDLKLLAQHNSRLSQYKRLAEALGEGRVGAVPAAARTLYGPTRALALGERVVAGLLRANGKNELLDKEMRRAGALLIKAFDQLGEKAGARGGILTEFDIYYRLRRLFNLTYKIEQQMRQQGHPKHAQYRQLWHDVNFQIKLLDIIRMRMERLIDEAPIEWKKMFAAADDEAKAAAAAKRIWRQMSRHLRRLVHENGRLAAFLEDDLYAAARPADKPPRGQQDLTKLDRILAGVTADIIKDIARGGGGRAGGGAGGGREARPRRRPNIFETTDAYERGLLERFLRGEGGGVDGDDPVFKAYEGFDSLDEVLYPIEFIAGLYEKDIIETVRISPSDAVKGFSNKGLSDKVSGDSLYHFAGFFKRSWRSNDILWGRLDGLCQLVETLLSREVLSEVTRDPNWRARVRGFLFEGGAADDDSPAWRPEMKPERLFPQAGAETHKLIGRWLVHLLSPDERKRRGALEEKEFGEKLELLIEAAQLEVLREEVPNVIVDALGEQTQWNQFRLALSEQERAQLTKKRSKGLFGRGGGEDGGGSDPLGFEPGEGALDPFVAVVAATGRAESVMERFREAPDGAPPRPSKTRLGRFFKNQYAVGTEELLRDIPRVILLEMLAVSMLVLRNCVLGIFAERAAKVRSHPLYLFGVDYPLRVFYSLVLFMRRAPRAWIFFLATLGTVSALALAVGLYWRNPIIYTNGGLSLTCLGLFVGLPLVILTAEVIYLLKKDFARRTLGRLLRSAAGAAALAVLLTAPLILGAAYAGLERVHDRGREALESQYLGRVPLLGGLLTRDEIWRRRAARAGVISAGALLFLSPYLGAYWLLRRSRRSRRGAGELRQELAEYFNLDDMGVIARRLVGSEIIERARLLAVVGSYIDVDAEDFRADIEPFEEIEWGRWEGALREYVAPDKLNLIARRLRVEAVGENGVISYLNKSLPPVVDEARLRAVMWDYLGCDEAQLGRVVGALLASGAATQGTLLSQGADQCRTLAQRFARDPAPGGAGPASANAPPAPAGRAGFPAQRHMLSTKLVSWRELRRLLDDYVSEPEMARLVAGRLNLPAGAEREAARAPFTYGQLLQVLRSVPRPEGGDAHVTGFVSRALESLERRLEDAKLVEWAKVRRTVEERLSVGAAVQKIAAHETVRAQLRRGGRVRGESLLKLLKTHYILDEEQRKIEESLLGLHGPVWEAGADRTNDVLIAALEAHDPHRELLPAIEERLGEKDSLAFPDLRILLREFFSEADVRDIASAVAARTDFAWEAVDETLRRGLSASSMMKKIAERLTTSMSGAEPTPAQQRAAMAGRLVDYAKRNRLLRRLEEQMRATNPEALYYL